MKPQDAVDFVKEASDAREHRLGIFAHQPEQLTCGKGPLSGIAVGIKDIFDTHDMPTGYGSRVYDGHRPVSDASLVSMLRRSCSLNQLRANEL